MVDSSNGLPPRLLRTQEAARYLGLSRRTLEKHRSYGTGPTYRKLGGRVVYALDDLNVWADRGLRRSTSDPGTGTVHPAKRMDENTPRPRESVPAANRRNTNCPDSGRSAVRPTGADGTRRPPERR